MNSEQIRARLAEIQGKQTAIIDGSGDAGMTPEQQTEFDALAAEFDKLTGDLDRAIRLDNQRAMLAASPGRKTAPSGPAAASTRIEGGRDRVLDDPWLGFANAADFARSVRNAVPQLGGDVDKRLQILGAPSNYHETQGSDGYMIPPAMRAEIWGYSLGDDSLFAMMSPEPTDSNRVEYLRDETTPWGNTGVQSYWGAEAAQFTPSRLETKGSTLALHKLHAYVTATEELLSDAPRLANRLTVQAGRAIGWKLDEAIMRGNGVGQPLGILAAGNGAKIEVAKETNQTADTVVAGNVLKMFSRALSPQRGFWLANSDTIPTLAVMTIGDQPVWTSPTSGLNGAPGGMLLGRPVYLTEHCDTVGDVGDIVFVVPEGYYAVNKAGGISFQASMHLYFDYDVQAFKWTVRVGGSPFASAPVTPPNSALTKSHFVTLAARA